MDKSKVSKAQADAVYRYEAKNYLRVLVRFPKDREQDIRQAAGDSLNGFIVKAVLDAVARSKSEDGQSIEQ